MFSKNPLFNLLKYTWHYSFDLKKAFIFFISFSILGNIVWLLQPIVIGRIFNNIQFAGQVNLSIPENTEPLNWQIIWENF